MWHLGVQCYWKCLMHVEHSVVYGYSHILNVVFSIDWVTEVYRSGWSISAALYGIEGMLFVDNFVGVSN